MADQQTRRDQFIQAALQGLCAGLQWTPGLLIHEDELASDAVAIADAALKKAEEPTNG